MVYLLDSLNQSLCYLKFQRDLYSMTFGICESLNAHDYREMISIIKFLIVINLKVDLYNTLRYMIIGEIIALVAINGKQIATWINQVMRNILFPGGVNKSLHIRTSGSGVTTNRLLSRYVHQSIICLVLSSLS